MKLLSSCALGLLFAAALPQAPADLFIYASAHAAESSIPSWVSASCCGPKDARKLRADQIYDQGDYYVVEGYPEKIQKFYQHVPNAEIKPSQDGDYWIFSKAGGETECAPKAPGTACHKTQPQIYCLFIPMGI